MFGADVLNRHRCHAIVGGLQGNVWASGALGERCCGTVSSEMLLLSCLW